MGAANVRPRMCHRIAVDMGFVTKGQEFARVRLGGYRKNVPSKRVLARTTAQIAPTLTGARATSKLANAAASPVLRVTIAARRGVHLGAPITESAIMNWGNANVILGFVHRIARSDNARVTAMEMENATPSLGPANVTRDFMAVHA